MRLFQLKYGFLTTYNETIFLKQELGQAQEQQQHRRGHQQQEVAQPWILWYSSVIHHSTSSVVPTDTPPTYRNRVSVRECMFFLLSITSGGPEYFTASNNMPMKDWVSPK